MVDLNDIYHEVLIVKKDVESVKHQTSWLLRSHAENVAQHWREIFGIKTSTKRNYSKMRVFLETNGKRTVQEIAIAANVHAQDASVWLKEMAQEHIVELLPQTTNKKVYQKTPADFSLGISDALRTEIEKKEGESKKCK